jgi:hypothetical protein
MQALHVELRDHDILVTMPGTSFRVVYRRPNMGPGLVARLDYFQNQQKGPIIRGFAPNGYRQDLFGEDLCALLIGERIIVATIIA